MATFLDRQGTIEVEPPCNKPRLQGRTHFVHLKLHTRLIIYDYYVLGHDEFDDGKVNFLYSGDDMKRSYERMSIAASILGDLEVLQYLAEIPDNNYKPQNYDSASLDRVDIYDMDEPFYMEDICYYLASNAQAIPT
jgi:hypothetical protein